MAARLFGTDGVRGIAGEPPLDPCTVTRLGAALVRALPAAGRSPRLLVGRDTRESGEWIERALAAGVASQGARLTSAGVLPTPGIAFLTRDGGFDAGLVISASHNPYADNGIKVFSGRGEKFGEVLERRIEAIVADRAWTPSAVVDPAVERVDLAASYLAHLRRILPSRNGEPPWRIVVDCANGATYQVAPRLFRSLGFDVTVLGDQPDGRNINLNCGSTHPEALAARVREDGFRLGITFDGDGDRALFVDQHGRTVNGDAVLLLCAKSFKRAGTLADDAIVATVMSNIGLEVALREAGIGLVRCQVGDKYVMEEMINRGLSLGGEQSGHIIFSEHLFTGDGLATALYVLRTMLTTGRDLADLAGELVTYPQVLVNVRVKEKRPLDEVPAVQAVMADVEGRLEPGGRLLVRYSGTEPLLRIMLEGPPGAPIDAWAHEIADVVRDQIG